MNGFGRTALVTGASSGIGAAIASQLAADGLQVLLVARRAECLEVLAETIRGRGGQAWIFPADLACLEARLALADQVQDRFGPPDVLVNNAGFAWFGWYSQMPWEIARNILQVNVEAAAHLTHLFVPGMLRRRSGHIINIGSIAGRLPNQGIAIYGASKAFLGAFTTSLYRELKGSGVQVSEVRPGPVATEFFDVAEGLANGRRIPGEHFAVPAGRVAADVSRLLQQPRRVIYSPGWMRLSPLLEILFGWAIDRVGPVLLNRQKG